MAAQQQNQTPHHRLRHYLIMVTVVIIGLFVLLLFNGKSGGFSITSAVVENVKNSSLIGTISNVRQGSNSQNSFPEAERVSPSSNIEFLLLSSAIPQIAKETKMETMTLVFNDLTTPITVNNDQLELSGLSEVTLELTGYRGTIEVNERQFSIDGIAKKFKVNGISLSSSSEIKVLFNGLNYQRATLDSAEFKDLELVSGEGSLQIGNRLRYGLEAGQIVTLYNYQGDISINKALPVADLNSTIEDSGTVLQGLTKGLDVVNGELNLNLR